MIETLLSRLTQVKGRNGSWIACCPAHEDRRPSMSIRDDGGKILIHCFAGCEVESILGVVGMDLTDLFPPDEDRDYKPQQRTKLYASDVLKTLHFETEIVVTAAAYMAMGKQLEDADRDRLMLAYQRIDQGKRMVEGYA